jgi:hypothetical protein
VHAKHALRGALLVSDVDIAVQGIIGCRARLETGAIHRGDARRRVERVRAGCIDIGIDAAKPANRAAIAIPEIAHVLAGSRIDV